MPDRVGGVALQKGAAMNQHFVQRAGLAGWIASLLAGVLLVTTSAYADDRQTITLIDLSSEGSA